jgi:hypothetical protein
MFLDLLENFGLQAVFFIGLISALGLLIWRLNKTLYKLLGAKAGRRVFLTTGVIGTPIHEFGHVFFCVIFRHRIKEVKWFTPNSTDGTLGYVLHTYNKKNVYHQIGNFFIGLGPLLFGSAVIVILMYIFMPNASQVSFAGGTSAEAYFTTLWAVFLAVFDLSNFASVLWWIFIILSCSIAMHMDLSIADIKGSARGLVWILVIMLVLNTLLCVIDITWAQAVTHGCLWLSISVVSFMAVAILLLSVPVAVCALVRLIKQKFFKRGIDFSPNL